jgi:hypothetical protein
MLKVSEGAIAEPKRCIDLYVWLGRQSGNVEAYYKFSPTNREFNSRICSWSVNGTEHEVQKTSRALEQCLTTFLMIMVFPHLHPRAFPQTGRWPQGEVLMLALPSRFAVARQFAQGKRD